jgi:SAM-dependent methyltransferase
MPARKPDDARGHRVSVIHRSAALGFARAPEAYERGRPPYPEDAITWLAEALGLRPGRGVLDLAAGTGRLTRALASTGADVVAVEPVAEMRAKIAETLPEVEVLTGTAESIPLADAAVDATTVGQAFHWFRGDEALTEIHRVLRPGGRLGLIWNGRDDSAEWVAALTRIMEPYRGDAPAYRRDEWRKAFGRTPLFGALEHRRFRLDHELDPEGLVARVTSVSFIAALPDDEREAVVSRVRDLVRGRDRITLPYRTDVFWCERR